MATLERSLTQLADDFQRERAALTAAAQRQRDDFEAESTSLRRMLKCVLCSFLVNCAIGLRLLPPFCSFEHVITQ